MDGITEDLELRYLKALNDKDIAEQKIEELRIEMKDCVPVGEKFTGTYINITHGERKGQSDWKACVGMMVGGDADAMKELGNKFRKDSSVVFTVKTNKVE